MRVSGGVDENKKSNGKLNILELAYLGLLGNTKWFRGVGSSDQAAGEVDSGCSHVGAVEPLRLVEAKEFVTGGHGRVQESAMMRGH